MFLGKTYQEFGPALVGDSIIVLKGRVSVRDDGMNMHAVSMFHARSRRRRQPRAVAC